jgi:hypothetical protein
MILDVNLKLDGSRKELTLTKEIAHCLGLITKSTRTMDVAVSAAFAAQEMATRLKTDAVGFFSAAGC